jgi:hypothetical protein
MAQRVLKRPLTSKDALAHKDLDELHELLRQLEAELG